MSRETSIESYHAALASGLVSRRRGEVLRIVAYNGPMTANEAFNILASELGARFRFDSNTRARFTELREMDLLDEVGTRDCTITKRRCILWEVSGRPAQPLKKKPTERERIQELEAEIARLTDDNQNLRDEIEILKQQPQQFSLFR